MASQSRIGLVVFPWPIIDSATAIQRNQLIILPPPPPHPLFVVVGVNIPWSKLFKNIGCEALPKVKCTIWGLPFPKYTTWLLGPALYDIAGHQEQSVVVCSHRISHCINKMYDHSYQHRRYIFFKFYPFERHFQNKWRIHFYWRKISQQTQNICITFVQRRPNVLVVVSTLYKWYTK